MYIEIRDRYALINQNLLTIIVKLKNEFYKGTLQFSGGCDIHRFVVSVKQTRLFVAD